MHISYKRLGISVQDFIDGKITKEEIQERVDNDVLKQLRNRR